MKRIIIMLAAAAVIMALLAGCGEAKPTAASASASATPTATSKPASTAPVSVTPVPDQTHSTGGDETYKTTVGDWDYFLDLKDTTQMSGYDAYYIHRKKGSEDIRLNIACFKFYVYENYIYAQVDVGETDGFAHWKTYRYDLNGENKKELAYTDMFMLASGGKLYFTSFNDMTVYSADFACENVQPIKVNLPDADTIRGKLNNAPGIISLLTIKEIKDGWIKCTYEVADNQLNLLYSGSYRISLDGAKVEKLDEGQYSDITI